MENCAYLRKNPGYAPGSFTIMMNPHCYEVVSGVFNLFNVTQLSLN